MDKTVVLVRGAGDDQGTPGRFFIDGLPLCLSLELPDRGNAPMVSRIPAGGYLCVWQKSPRFGWCYQVLNVPGRSRILIHPANWAGDVSLGFKSDLNGCIAPGEKRGILAGQRAVLASRLAFNRFNKALNKAPFLLVVCDAGNAD